MNKRLIILITIISTLFVIACNPTKKVEDNFSKLKNYNIQENNNIKNITTENCAWILYGEKLDINQIDSIKKLISSKLTKTKVRTVSSSIDTLLKYKIKENCVVILE